MGRFWGIHEAKNLQVLLGIVEESSGKGGGDRWERDRGGYRKQKDKIAAANRPSQEEIETNPKLLSRKERRRLEFGEPTGVGRKKQNTDGTDGVESQSLKNNEAAKITSEEMINRALLNRLGSSSMSDDVSNADDDYGDGDSNSDNVIVKDMNDRELFVVPVSGSRGLHLKDIGVVYILTPPKTMDEYLHMAGRTGREGKSGTVITLASLDELKRLQSWQTALNIEYNVKYTR